MTARRTCLIITAILLPLAACRREEPRVYRVPKESEPDMPAAAGASANAGAEPGMAGGAVPGAEGPALAWKAPAAWAAKPLSAMRKGSYSVPGAGAEAGDLSVTAFPGDVGGELANVNRWRGQVQLSPVDDSGLAAVVERTSLNGLPATVVDFGGEGAGAQRILGAIVPYQGNTWFFKLIGPGALVEKAKPDFLKFLQTVQPAGPAAPSAPNPMADETVPTAQGSALAWTAPAGWEPKPLSEMRKGSYAVHGADCSVSAFPGDVGGELANVNRWRGQVQLPPVDDSGLAAAVEHTSLNGLPATVVDCVGEGPGAQRILGAIVPYQGATWFFKLIGPGDVVEKSKPEFLKLLGSVHPAAAQ